MKNPIDQKFYLVAYFTPLTAFGKNLKTECQVRSGTDVKNAFFTLVKLVKAMQHEKIDFEVEISTFEKFLGICSGHVGVSKRIL